MTVAELIEVLSKMPRQLPVVSFRVECNNFQSPGEVGIVDATADPMLFDGEYLDGDYARHQTIRAVVIR